MQLLTQFAGNADAPNLQYDPFRCQVSLEGTSVIEGIRQMVKAGVTASVLPNYVANIKTVHRNKILIRPKQATSEHG